MVLWSVNELYGSSQMELQANMDGVHIAALNQPWAREKLKKLQLMLSLHVMSDPWCTVMNIFRSLVSLSQHLMPEDLREALHFLVAAVFLGTVLQRGLELLAS